MRITVVLFGVGLLLLASPGQADTCRLASEHGGLTFPVEQVAPDWTCRLQEILDSATTVSHVGPLRVDMSEALYRYLLDHPPVATTLMKRLDLGRYKSEERGAGRFWGDDGEGTKGIVQLVYEDHTSRIYYLEGSHDSRLLPRVTGKAVVFLRSDVVKGLPEGEAMDSTLVAYTMLDNRFLSGLVSLLHPLVNGMVKSRLQKGAETVHRLGLVMRQEPQRVFTAATTPTALADTHLAFLRTVLGIEQRPDIINSPARTAP